MSDTLLIDSETASAHQHRNGKSVATVGADGGSYTAYSTLKYLPGSGTNLSTETSGEEMGRIFSEQPDLPGVILFEGNRFAGVISQTHYYKCISRAFGREVYHRRPASIMLADIVEQPPVLPSDCPIEAAVEQCLARSADYVYEPFLIRDKASGQYRLCAFQSLLFASSQLAALRNEQMEQILNTVTDGLLVIDRNFRIGAEYSKIVERLFERQDVSTATLPEVLRPLIDGTTHDQLTEYLHVLFDPKLIDRLIKSINPAKQIAVRFPSATSSQDARVKHFAINFERIRIQTQISQVLVRIEDVTQRMEMAKELEKQEAAAEEKLHLVMQILQVEPDSLNRFVDRFDKMLAAIASLFESQDATVPANTINYLFRQVHTLKGESSMLKFAAHERALHLLEDHLEKLRANPQLQPKDLDVISPSWETLQGLGDQIHEALDQLTNLGATARGAAKPLATSASAQPMGLVDMISRLVSDLSQRLGKTVTFHTGVEETDLPNEHKDTLHETLLHLTRNSMVHGLESAEQRAVRGKNPQGFIQLHLKTHPSFYEVIFQDDGRGLDLDKIRRRAAQMGLKFSTDEELRMAIFEPGFSTAEQVTDLAGRGVGLDSVRHAVQKIGGRILPFSEQGAYCAFQILLPKNSTQGTP